MRLYRVKENIGIVYKGDIIELYTMKTKDSIIR